MDAHDLFEGLFLYGLIPIFSLMIAVTVHELGHYAFARLFGVRVDVFSFGLGREVLGITSKSGTRWRLSLWPVGGYVGIFGDCDPENPLVRDKMTLEKRPLTPEETRCAFYTRPVWKRMVIVLGGPFINMVFAFMVLFCLYTMYGERSWKPIINAIGIGTASEKAGFKLGDEILEMDGTPVRRLSDVHDFTYAHPDVLSTYTVLRDGKTIQISMIPEKVDYTDTKGVVRTHGRTGMTYFNVVNFKDIRSVNGIPTVKDPDKARHILKTLYDKELTFSMRFREGKDDVFRIQSFPAEFNHHLDDPQNKNYDKIYAEDPEKTWFLRLSIPEAVNRSFEQIMDRLSESAKLLSVFYKGKTEEPAVGGITKIAEFAGKSAKEGGYSFIIFLVSFSVIIGIMNLLPIPLLDGGFFLFLLYELVRGKPLSHRAQNIAFIIGLVFLGGIMIIANVSDLVRLLR